MKKTENVWQSVPSHLKYTHLLEFFYRMINFKTMSYMKSRFRITCFTEKLGSLPPTWNIPVTTNNAVFCVAFTKTSIFKRIKAVKFPVQPLFSVQIRRSSSFSYVSEVSYYCFNSDCLNFRWRTEFLPGALFVLNSRMYELTIATSRSQKNTFLHHLIEFLVKAYEAM